MATPTVTSELGWVTWPSTARWWRERLKRFNCLPSVSSCLVLFPFSPRGPRVPHLWQKQSTQCWVKEGAFRLLCEWNNPPSTVDNITHLVVAWMKLQLPSSEWTVYSKVNDIVHPTVSKYSFSLSFVNEITYVQLNEWNNLVTWINFKTSNFGWLDQTFPLENKSTNAVLREGNWIPGSKEIITRNKNLVEWFSFYVKPASAACLSASK